MKIDVQVELIFMQMVSHDYLFRHRQQLNLRLPRNLLTESFISNNSLACYNMGLSFWCLTVIILLVLLSVPCTQSSCHENYLPGGYYFTTGRNMVEDHSLYGHVFKKFTVSMPVECFSKCRYDCHCISFNYLTTVNQDNCELNEENKHLKPNALQRKKGSQYYDLVIDYNVVVSKQTAMKKGF